MALSEGGQRALSYYHDYDYLDTWENWDDPIALFALFWELQLWFPVVLVQLMNSNKEHLQEVEVDEHQ